MKKFLIGFLGTFFGITITISIGVGAAMVARYFIEDRDLSAAFGFLVVVCVLIGLLCTFDDEDEKGMVYKVQIGGENFYCKEVKHKEDTDTVLIAMDGIESRVSLDTDIIISKL